MSRRAVTPLVGALAIVIVVVAALVAFGLRPTTVDRFSLRATDSGAVAQLRPGQHVCEGPITVAHSIDRATVFGAAILPFARVTVQARDARTGALRAAGSFDANAVAGPHTVTLDRRLDGGRPLRICIRATLNGFSVQGSSAPDPAIRMSGRRRHLAFSLALGSGRSTLGALGLAFSRASLFKPSWVGAWTYWLLAALVLAAFGLGAVAVAAASDADGDTETQDRSQPHRTS